MNLLEKLFAYIEKERSKQSCPLKKRLQYCFHYLFALRTERLKTC